jgi:beta-galactosidase
VRFGLAGDGKLLDNLGTSTGSRYVQMYNGRAMISINTRKGKNTVSAKVDGVSTELLNL